MAHAPRVEEEQQSPLQDPQSGRQSRGTDNIGRCTGTYGKLTLAMPFRGRPLRDMLSSTAIAIALVATSVPALAGTPAVGLYRVKRPKVKPADAAAKRAEAEVRGNALVDSGDSIAAGIEFDNAAAELGDPILYLEAGEAYLTGCEESRNKELAEASIERARISLDILYFHLDKSADKNFRLVEATEIPALIVRAQDLIKASEALVEEIEAEEAAAAAEPEEEDAPPSKSTDGRAAKITGGILIGAGAVAIGIGAAGIALGVRHQQTAEHSTVYGAEYDQVAKKGERANMLAFVGVPTGLVLAGVGVAVLVLTSKKRKEKRKNDKYSVVPTFDRHGTGVAISGRF
ncbi:MAG: hypothetical protein ACRBN8_07835 [Nannocystales bacterium]